MPVNCSVATERLQLKIARPDSVASIAAPGSAEGSVTTPIDVVSRCASPRRSRGLQATRYGTEQRINPCERKLGTSRKAQSATPRRR
jgi:hypothetical protein